MKKMTQVYWVFLLSSVLLVPAFAQDNASAGKETADKESRYEATLSQLNLSAGQKERIKALRQNQKQQMKELRQSFKEARQKLKEHLDKSEANHESIAPLANDIKNILGKMVDQRIENVLAVKSVLTPEQFSQLQEAQKSRKDERGGRPFWLGKGRGNQKHEEQH